MLGPVVTLLVTYGTYLLPVSSQLNRQKSDRVPSEVMLRGAQTRIQDW